MANYKVIVPFLKAKEGGLSRNPSDNASSDPMPCSFQGKTGYHTNKGITWKTFKANASLGYPATCEMFVTMPDSVWGLIFKKSYWNYWNSDTNPYQSIADFLTWCAWGSGTSGSKSFLKKYLASKGIKADSKEEIYNAIIKLADKNEFDTWNELIEFRRNWYKTLNDYPTFKNGWNNALNSYVEFGIKNYNFKKKRINFKVIVPIAVILGTGYYLYTEGYFKKLL